MRIVLLFIALCSVIHGYSQDNEKTWRLSGYVKDMVSINGLADSTLVDNLIHQRFNFEWRPDDNWSIQVGMRNRLVTGDLVKAIPNYVAFIDTNNDYFDLSFTWLDRNNAVGLTVFDRAYVEWRNETWEMRLGRQRINWGTNVVWNPNDIFNAYSFFDFDYEERPGSDALRITRYFSYSSSIEIAVKMAKNIDESVAAILWKFNKGKYDIQFISGIAAGDLVGGIGWAGNLGNASFKGEISYFNPYEQRIGGENGVSGSIGLDYSFKNGLYVLSSYLFSSDGIKTIPAQNGFLFSSERLSARKLMPFKHSVFAQGSYPLTPLINVGLGAMTFPGDNSLFFNPTFGLSISQSIDLGLFGQFYFDNNANGDYEALSKSVFIRMKWSF